MKPYPSRYPLEFLARFWAKVRKDPDGHWRWTAATSGGLGAIGFGGHRSRTLKAHRVAYELVHGPNSVPEGHRVVVSCEEKNCVRPDHLRTSRGVRSFRVPQPILSLPDEQWKWVVGFEGAYEVSNFGRVRTYRASALAEVTDVPHALLRGSPHKAGYQYFRIWGSDGKVHKLYLHDMILTAFVGPRPMPKHEARHLNGRASDTRLDNLAWGTRQENIDDIRRHGTRKTRFTEDQIREIKRRLAAKEHQRKIAKDFGVKQGYIANINIGRSWRHVHVS